jgi:hypothetical protein
MVRRLKKDSWAGRQSPTATNRKTPPPTAQPRKRRTKNLDDRPNFLFSEKRALKFPYLGSALQSFKKKSVRHPDIYKGLAAGF